MHVPTRKGEQAESPLAPPYLPPPQVQCAPSHTPLRILIHPPLPPACGIFTRPPPRSPLTRACMGGQACSFYSRGKCVRGTSCPFSHSAALASSGGGHRDTEVCKFMASTGSCRFGTRCRFSHAVASPTGAGGGGGTGGGGAGAAATMDGVGLSVRGLGGADGAAGPTRRRSTPAVQASERSVSLLDPRSLFGPGVLHPRLLLLGEADFAFAAALVTQASPRLDLVATCLEMEELLYSRSHPHPPNSFALLSL